MNADKPFPSSVAVDLTPVLPGGDNGGAKIVAQELIPLLAIVAAPAKFLLLTRASNHGELARLEAANARCVRVDTPMQERGAADNAALRAHSLVSAIAPRFVLDRLAGAYRGLRNARGMPSLLRQLGADVLFCPFGDPFYEDAAIPFVSVVADLQFLDMPQFFPPETQARLQRQFTHIARRAARIVCISESVRAAVARFGAPPERLVVIHHALHHRFGRLDEEELGRMAVAQCRVEPFEYLLYPANFWPHKNHAALVQAFELYVRRAPNSHLKLVLTGAGGTERPHVVEAVNNAGLADRVVFTGFVSDAQLAALMRWAFALVFPSLYEGFGMPVAEAMAAGTPVLCSNATSLPEIAGDAALFFDPRDPEAICGAIAQLARDPGLRSRLTALGTGRIASFGSATRMAESYWRVIREAATDPMLR